MSEHRYERQALMGAYVRAGAGVALTGGPLVLVPVETVVGVVLAALAALFLAYGAHTFLRQRTSIVVDDEMIRSRGPLGRAVPWRELSHVRLKYYSTRRDGRNGWHELDLRGRGNTLRIESTLTGFGDIVARAVRESERQGIELNPATRSNLHPFGLVRDPRPQAEHGR